MQYVARYANMEDAVADFKAAAVAMDGYVQRLRKVNTELSLSQLPENLRSGIDARTSAIRDIANTITRIEECLESVKTEYIKAEKNPDRYKIFIKKVVSIAKPAKETFGYVKNIAKAIGEYITKELKEMLPPGLAKFIEGADLISKILDGMKIASLIAGVVGAAATGKCVFAAIGDAVAGAAHFAAQKVFGKLGKEVGKAVGAAGGAVGYVAGYVVGSAAGKFAADYIFLDKASAAFGAIKVDGLGLSAGISKAVANIAKGAVSAPATGMACGGGGGGNYGGVISGSGGSGGQSLPGGGNGSYGIVGSGGSSGGGAVVFC